MELTQAVYALCSVAFLALIALMLLRGRTSAIGIAIVGACALSAAWAANLAVPDVLPRAIGTALDSLRLSAWLILLVALMRLRESPNRLTVSLTFLLAVGFCLVVVGYELMSLLVSEAVSDIRSPLDDFLRIALGVGGLLAAENLLRNTDETQRHNLLPLCLALGGTFAFELFLYAERLMIPGSSPILPEGRGIISLLSVPLLALAMARNREWRVDIHVSRTVALHTAALVASGIFFLALAATGFLVRQLGGGWGPTLQLLTLVGSAVVLASAFGSRALRIYLKQLIARHFFSHRFDYRAEWLRFVDTVSRPGTSEEGLLIRVVRALAQIVDSPAGTLWCLREGRSYLLEVGWNVSHEGGRKISIDDPFVAGFRGGEWIQQRSPKLNEDCPFDFAGAWLAIPLSYSDEMIGFAVLASPSHLYSLDGETIDLLCAAGKQAASYLAEERSTRELTDSRLLNEYSKRFAFVIHDIKNLANQLGLVVANARHYFEDPEFRKDMLLTVEDSVAQMGRLLTQLQAKGVQLPPQVIEPDPVIVNVAQELSAGGTFIETRLAAEGCRIAINGDQFRSMLFHLINNAFEATPPETMVVVSSRATHDQIIIDVVDKGPGMDDDFIRHELFRPFRSTKTGGFGIGAYQTRELLRSSGGELEVISKKGAGTTMRVMFPTHSRVQLVSSAA